MKRNIPWLCVAALLMAGLAVQGEDELMRTVVYPIVFGDPSALETISRSMVDGQGHVVLDAKGNRLIIVTTESRHRQLNEVLGQADAQTGNVQIQVRFRDVSSERDRGFSVQGRGGVVVHDGETRGVISIQPEVRDALTESSGDTRQTLLVASGREGRIRVGEQVPYIDWISDYGWRGGYSQTSLQWQEVGSFLTVIPTIMGDGKTIHIRLIPELRGLVDGNPFRVQFAGLATEVMVQDGVTMTVGGAAKDEAFYSRFLVGMNRSGRQRVLDIEMTPRIVNAGMP
ncbi:MAG TPA: hypothetical protein PKE26_10225 [Kiritimatiellia bacterium]|nr:hypothetical protein [Kiritimatiellia bacterium]HMO99474.1 hypothetical protein [Kiritimatiellia bacterium]HMP97073.1 hypothetical protein [Kiritimatiellia bacterium]